MTKTQTLQSDLRLAQEAKNNVIKVIQENSPPLEKDYLTLGKIVITLETLKKQLSSRITSSSFTKVSHDTNGNPRYVLHFLSLLKEGDNSDTLNNKYNKALVNAKPFNGRKFHNKQYGGGIIFSSYNLDELAEDLNNFLEANNTL